MRGFQVGQYVRVDNSEIGEWFGTVTELFADGSIARVIPGAGSRRGHSGAWDVGTVTLSPAMTPAQTSALSALCERFHVAYNPAHYAPAFDLPAGWFAGWIGGYDAQATHPTIYVGCDPAGRCSS